jgi:hypothetical protein
MRNDARGGSGRRCWDRDTYHLICPEVVGRGDTRACSAYVQRLGKFNEFNTGGVYAAEKDGHLKTNPRRAAALGRVQALTLSVDLDFQTSPIGTRGLVRLCIFNARK